MANMMIYYLCVGRRENFDEELPSSKLETGTFVLYNAFLSESFVGHLHCSLSSQSLVQMYLDPVELDSSLSLRSDMKNIA